MSDYLIKSKQYKGYHYSVLKPEMLDYLHNTTKEIFKAIKVVLDENEIPYMICGGTLLGAVTTGKFIPWDDDVDMCVFEEDYEKMKALLLNSLPDWIEVQCPETEPHYYHGWIKVRDKHSSVHPDEPMYNSNGVWVDIYKLTKAKCKDVEALIIKEHLDYLGRRHRLGCITDEEYEKRVMERDLLNKLKVATEASQKSTDSNEVYIIWSASKILVEPQWCYPLSNYQFEEMAVTSFHSAEAYLIRHYGENYKKLPPDEMRRVGINKVEVIGNQIIKRGG